MSQRLNVQALINAGVHQLVNLCPTDTRFYQYLNSFQERALSYGRWWGCTALMDFCVTPSNTGACVILPREVATIEAIKIGGIPARPRNAWYSFVTPHAEWSGCGSGPQNLYPYGCPCGCGCGPFVSQDKLTVPSFGVTTTGQKIRFYFDPEDAGKTIIVQGYDADNIWVRTEIDGVWQDGEQVTLAVTGDDYYTDTETLWYIGSPTGINKEVTAKRVLMFAADDPFEDDDAAQQLADYQPGETLPSYRKFKLPAIGCNSACSSITARCVVSLQHIPVSQPNDWLLFQNIPAYEDGIQAVRYWREGNRAEGDAYFFGMNSAPRSRRGDLATVKLGGALPTLQAELRKMSADLTTIQVNRAGVRLPSFV